MASDRMVEIGRDDVVRMCTVMELTIMSLQKRNAPPHLIERVNWARETLMHSLWPNGDRPVEGTGGVDEQSI